MEVAPVRIRAFAMRDSEMGLFFVLKGVFYGRTWRQQWDEQKRCGT